MPKSREYEEQKLLPQKVGWLLLFLLSACIIGYALWVHALVPDAARQWDFGALQQTPAASIYATQPTPLAHPPSQQVHPLPEARPLSPANNVKEERP